MGPPGPPPSGRPSSLRAWIICAALVVVAVVVTVVATVGGHDQAVTGRPTPVPGGNPHTVAVEFAGLEARRYNAGDPPPQPTRAAYGAVSCQADLAQMAATGPTLPPLPAHPRYTFAVTSVTASRDGRELLDITRTDTSTGDSGDGLFYLEQQAGWRVCGLFKNTEPPPPSDAPSTAGTGGSSGSAQSISAAVQSFLATFAASVGAGEYGTAVQAICTHDPAAAAADRPVESWAMARAHVQVQLPVDTSGGTDLASARVEVSQSGQPPTTYGLVIEREAGRWCIDQVQRS